VSETRELAVKGGSLRAHAARGTIINGAFDVGVGVLGLVRGFIVAGLVSAHDYGVWGILVIAFGTLSWLKQFGVPEKYVQQDEPDQELAFQRAFTIEAMANIAFAVVLLAAIPLAVVVYGQHAIVAPALVLALVIPAYALQAPLWVFYRRMDFVRQRTLQAVDPVVSFVVTVVAAALGAGYWSFLAGLLAGGWINALLILRASPYPLRWRYDAATLRSYASFSWPLFVVGISGVLVAQGSIIAASQHLGLAGVGAIALATTIGQMADRVDGMISLALYPAICAIAEKTELLFETFVKANRLALMWGVPFGAGVALFAADLVHHVIGDRWAFAIDLIRLVAVATAINQIAFNWHSYFRARSQTRPLAVAAVLSVVFYAGLPIPLLLTHGLSGYGWGVVGVAGLQLVVRAYYLGKLFGRFSMLAHTVRALAPTVLPAAAILAWRAAGVADRTSAEAFGELLAYLALTVLATVALERDLLRELRGYLRREPAPPVAPAPSI